MAKALLDVLCREIVKQLIEIPEWPLLMRHTFIDSQTELDTTPFREMIKKMPGILSARCTDTRPVLSRAYTPQRGRGHIQTAAVCYYN